MERDRFFQKREK